MDLHPTPNKQHTQGNRMPIDGLTSDSKQITQTRKQNANTWTYIRLQTMAHANQRTLKKKGYQIDKLIGSLELEPNSCHTNTKRRLDVKRNKKVEPTQKTMTGDKREGLKNTE